MGLARKLISNGTDIIRLRNLIIELAITDFKKKYLGSFLGVFWAFVQPAATILIFWFVFQVGFKSAPVDNFPFILWLVTGMTPWFFFSEALSNATGSIVENAFLVKKVVFKVGLLPLVKIVSAIMIHVFFIAVTFLLFFAYGYAADWHYLQVFYYLIATILLVLGLSLITSSLLVFVKDIGQIVGIILQFGFWLTPIFWSIKILPQKYHALLMLNPLYYIVEGYRNTFIYHRWFWEFPYLTLYFWGFTILALLLGGILFHRLRPHFADVL
jgi:ABC-type polysaccharide/polyol phosphate export permease